MKLLTADVEVGGGGVIGQGGTGLYLKAGRVWEGTWVEDSSVDADVEEVDDYLNLVKGYTYLYMVCMVTNVSQGDFLVN